ncbi:hypothetical protein [Actinoplanes xinjiangensis]|uniref:hypothetical protein n=1 Tax=Actinoplanes xinjiangensis TaxID=512350 RepID=UPI00342E7728
MSTEFVDFSWWMAGFLVFLPVGIAAYLKPDAVGPILVAALLPQMMLPTVLIARSIATKWGDGTEFFGYLYPALMALLFSLAAGIGTRIRVYRGNRTPPGADEPARPETSRLAP